MCKNGIISDTKLMFSYIKKNDRLILPLKAFSIFLRSVEVYIGAVYIKWIVDYILGLNELNRENLFSIGIFVFFVQLVAFFIHLLSNFLNNIIIARRVYVLKNTLQNEFILCASKQDLARYEDVGFYDTYTKCVRYADNKAIDIMNILFDGLQNVFNFVAIVSIIIVLDWQLLLIVVIMAAISVMDQSRSNKLSYELYEAEQGIDRKSEYIKRIAHHKDYAKEVRIYNLPSFLIKKLNDSFNEKFKVYKKTNKKYWRLKFIVSFINSILFIPIILIYLSYEVLSCQISIGSFTTLFYSCFMIAGYISNIIGVFDKIKFESKYYITKLRNVLQYANIIEKDNDYGLEIDKILSVVFKDVCFSYPKHNDLVLNKINFAINANERIALVGKNGSGKTTIIKLLLRLYDPISGEIYINGVDIRKYNVISLRRCFSVVFQDFHIYNFSIDDNIKLNDQYIDCFEGLKFVSMDGKVKRLENREKTYVGREFDENGEDFSGGELQRIAIARAAARKNRFMIFDEANSSLDPFAEVELNNKLLEISTKSTTLVVSHRLTTTVSADRILLVDGGEIKEFGSHNDLMKRNGLYKKMYEIQSKAYLSQNELNKYEKNR